METTAFNITTCDGGNHKRKDRPNGGMCVREADAANTIAALTPTISTVAVQSPVEDSSTLSNPDTPAPKPDTPPASLSSLCDEALGGKSAEVVAPGCFNMGGNKAGAGTNISGASPSILAQHGTDPHAVAIGLNVCTSPRFPDGGAKEGVAATLAVSHLGGVAIAIEGNGSRPSHQGGGFNDKEVSFTLNTIEHHGVAIGLKSKAGEKSRSPISVEHAQALSAGCHDSSVAVSIKPISREENGLETTKEGVDLEMATEEQTDMDTMQKQTPPPLTHIVRRLTVRECERLMGFPDNWTRIPWRIYKEAQKKGISGSEYLAQNDWESIRKAIEECPDSPRYKALGNSMATNCMEWVLRRIVQAIQEHRV